MVFDDMTADMKANKRLSPIFIELLLRGKKLNISLVFTSQSYFKVFTTIRLNAAHYFILEIPSKRKLQQMASNHLGDIEFKDFIKLYKYFTKEPFLFLVNDSNLPSGNLLRFGKRLL